MVLSLMRKHAKSWLIKFLIAMIAIVFIFYFGYSFRSKEAVKVAYVNGELISGVEYQKAKQQRLEALQRTYKNVWSDNLAEVLDVKNIALQELVDQILISQEAKRIGLDVTKEEIRERISAYPAFQFKGRFDETRYRSLLQNSHMKPEDFEKNIAQELLQEKVGQFLTTFTPVTDEEILDYYTFLREKVKISYVKFSPEPLKASIKVDPAKMEKYFQEHKEQYRIPKKIKIAYIVLDPKNFEDQVIVTDQDVRDYYQEHLDQYKVNEQVKARHILFKLDPDAGEEEVKKVRERALGVLERARKGEDFAQLAKKYSEGPTKDSGGELGYFSKGQMLKPFEEAAFKMKKGEISDLVRSPVGFHIIKVEDVKKSRTKGLDEVREEITQTLRRIRATDLAYEKGLSLMDQMPYDANLVTYASKHDVPVKESGYFSQTEEIQGIGGDDKLRQSLFSLEKNDITDLMEYDGKYYIMQVVDKKDSFIPEAKDVKEKLREDYVAFLAMGEAKALAEKFLAKLKEGADWNALCKEEGLTPKTSGFFTRDATIPDTGYNQGLTEAAFSLGEGHRYPDGVFQAAGGALVIRWEAEEGIDKAKFEKEKESVRRSLMVARHQAMFRDWLEELKSKAKIEIVTPVDRL